MDDVIRNGRTFSDGVGTCSTEVLEKIWREDPQARGLRPTIYQIRFRGKHDRKNLIASPRLTYIVVLQVQRASSLMILNFKDLLSA